MKIMEEEKTIEIMMDMDFKHIHRYIPIWFNKKCPSCDRCLRFLAVMTSPNTLQYHLCVVLQVLKGDRCELFQAKKWWKYHTTSAEVIPSMYRRFTIGMGVYQNELTMADLTSHLICCFIKSFYTKLVFLKNALLCPKPHYTYLTIIVVAKISWHFALLCIYPKNKLDERKYSDSSFYFFCYIHKCFIITMQR